MAANGELVRIFFRLFEHPIGVHRGKPRIENFRSTNMQGYPVRPSSLQEFTSQIDLQVTAWATLENLCCA